MSTQDIIAISYAKRALAPGTRERARIREYATMFGAYHLIVFTKSSEGFPAVQQEGALFLYATNAYTKIGMLLKAFWIGVTIAREQSGNNYVVSGQDPLAAGIVAVWISLCTKATLHIQMHGDIFNRRFFAESPLRPFKVALAEWVVRHAKKIRVVSKRIKDSLLLRGIPESKIVVVPIQSDIESFLNVGDTRTYNHTTPLTLLYVGRFSPEKNLPLLLTAFAQALSKYPNAQLQLRGDGPEKERLLALCAELSITTHVSFLPWSDDIASSMAAADVFCLASLHEGFAMVLVEAMATGLPIVTTDVGCVGDWLVHNEHGPVVPVDDATAYAEALSKLLADTELRCRLGTTAHAQLKAKNSSSEHYLHAIKESFTV